MHSMSLMGTYSSFVGNQELHLRNVRLQLAGYQAVDGAHVAMRSGLALYHAGRAMWQLATRNS